MKHTIRSKKEYHETMVKVYRLMDKGEENLRPEELKQLAAMAVAAEKYENDVLGLKPQKEPESIVEAVEQKMFEKRMSQSALAGQLGIGISKFSDILNGKRKPDVPFLKALYKVLKIDAGFLLEHA